MKNISSNEEGFVSIVILAIVALALVVIAILFTTVFIAVILMGAGVFLFFRPFLPQPFNHGLALALIIVGAVLIALPEFMVVV